MTNKTRNKGHVLTAVIIAAIAACGGDAGGGGGEDGGGGRGDGSVSAGGAGGIAGTGGGIAGTGGGIVGTGGMCVVVANAHGTPTEHRAQAVACAPSPEAPPAPDGGTMSCTRDADCAGDASADLFGHCLRGVCSFDQCLTDADCGTGGVCGCAADYRGNALYHANTCVPGNCRVDADCGAGGFCSPSRGFCGTYQGFYCHGPNDTCRNPASDCGGCGISCVYAPTAGAFVCGGSVCAG